MKKEGLAFLFRIFFFTAVVFCFHLLVLQYISKPLFNNQIIKAYIVNVLLAISIYFLLYSFKNRFRNQLGFLFLIGSFLKFLTFFVFFNNTYKQDSVITSLEFFSFFVPYASTLIIEVYSIAKWMNKLK